MDESKVRTFRADGKPYRSHSLASIERLLALEWVSVERHPRTGKIVAAYYRHRPGGDSPISKGIPTGTRYSFPERLDDTSFHVWKHKDLPASQESELHVRRIFRQSALDCLTEFHTKTQHEKVVSIASGKPKAPVRRPSDTEEAA